MKPTWKTWLILTLAALGILFVLDARANATASPLNQGELTFDVSEPVNAVLSVAVRDLVPTGREPILAREVNPIQWLGGGVGESGPSIGLDPLTARSVNGGTSPDPLVTFEGVPSISSVTPPDTNGDVGPNHYVQMTNFHYQIWDKGDPNNGIPPAVLAGPFSAGSLFASMGGQCTSNFGDPIVVYDDMADRWLLTQFGLSGPLSMCLAVSTTPDPTGTYFLYEIPTPDFPDYPKFGAWPDAYYMTTNTGFPNAYYAHAFDRVAMLAGAPATRQSFGGLPNLMLPADVDGPVPPPAGDPGIFYTYFHPSATGHPPGAERLAFYEFDVDWVTPGNTTYTLVDELPIAPFNYTICGFFAGGCVPQPGTGQLLDDIAWWPMHRMQYRNFGGYATMVGNFTVDADAANHAGIRWFEVRKDGSGYSLYQEGTHFPETDSRWMGSIAMDLSGNIALGYSVSSSTTIPSIRYATRLAGDPLGTLNAEAEMWPGGGVQTGIHRWGDYSAMTVDPVDGCTYWFTTEYHDVNDSGFSWNTRVGVFRIPSCGGPSGTLTGQVTDSGTSLGIPGAAVQATASITKTGFATTDASGFYTMTLLEGSYYVTATAFAYLPDSVSGVAIISGTTTTQDFSLDPAPNVVVDGYVTDSLMGWPLYASINIGNGFPGNPVWTDPVTGYYSVTLPVGVYPFDVQSFVDGYTAASTVVTVTSPLAASAPANIQLNNQGGEVPAGGGVTMVFSNTTPVAIPTGPAVVNSTINVAFPPFESGGNYLIDLNMSTNLVHSFSADLDVTLMSPAGTIVTLSTDNAAGNDNVFDGTFWDDGADPDGQVPYTTNEGSATDALYANLVTETPLVPEENFGAFIGENPNGTWTITVSDDLAGDGGSLNAWTLEITILPAPPATTTDSIANTTPVAIPTGPAVVASTLVVSGLGDTLWDLNLTTNLVHTFAADLDITLMSPAGTIVTLSTDNGAGNDNVFDGTFWDDDADPDGQVPYTTNDGLVSDALYANLVTETPLAPEEAFAAFIGEDPNGTWTITISDDLAGDGGSLNAWTLDITHAGGSSGQTENFALDADLNVCTAPGYTSVPSGGFSDDFESGYSNWTMSGLWNPENEADSCGSLVAPFPSSSNDAYYGIDGTCTFNNGSTTSGDLTLNSPVGVGAGSVLTFYSYEQTECNGPACPWDARTVQVSTDGGSSWQDAGEGDTENTWYQKTVDLSPYAGSVLVRFHFDSVDNIGNDFLGWMVDDVVISTYTCVPPTEGGLVVGNVYDANTLAPVNGASVTNETGSLGFAMETPSDPAVDDAFYTVYSLAGSQVHTATFDLYGEDVQTVGVVDFDTVEQDFYLPSGFIITDPTAFNVSLELGTNATLPLTLTDIGGANVEFLISEEPGTNPYLQSSVRVPASDGNFPRGSLPTSMGAVPQADGTTRGGLSPLATLSQLGGSTAYGVEHVNLYYTIFNIAAPDTLPFISSAPPTGGFIGAGEYFDGLVYMVDTTNAMWEVDPATGAILNTYTATAPPGGETYSGMALDPTSGVVYAGSTSCGASTLLTIDPPTGVASVVGTITNGGCLIGLAADSNGDLWGYDIIADVLLNIDKATGAGTVVGSIGFDANFGQGMGWDPDTDTLYMAAFNGGAFQAELRAVDRSTGNTTLIGVLGSSDPGGLTQVPWLGFELAGGDVPWVSEVPISGTVSANGDFIVDVTFDAAQVPVPGQYTAFLNISVDTPQLEVTVPLTLNVTCATCGTLEGDITDAATSLPLTATVRITSTGGFDLSIEDVTSYSAILFPGQYYVNASASGYLSETAVVDISTGATTTQDFALYANTSILSFSPASVEEFMSIGDVVSNTVTVTNSGAAEMEFEVNIGGYSGPLVLVPVSTQPFSLPPSDGNFPKGTAPLSMGAVPAGKVNNPAGAATLEELLGSSAYSIDHVNLFYTIFDVDVPEVLPNLGPMPPTGGFIGAGEYVNGLVYMIDTLNTMWEVDSATGTILNTYSATPPGGGETYSGLALDPTSGIVYAGTTSCGTSSLYTIDAPTGAATLIGSISNGGCLIGLAVDGNGDLWGYDIIADVLLNIDKDTGAGTVIGSIGFDANFGQGMGWDPDTDTLYMAAFNGGTFQPELRAVDRVTGNTTLIGVLGQTDPGGLSQLPWLGFEISGGGAGGWAYAVPAAGTVPGFSTTTFELVFDASSLYQVGDYYAELSFSGNFANDPATMPLTMHLDCPTCGFMTGDIYDAFTTAPVEADVFVNSTNGTAITLTGVASYSLALQPGTYDFLVTADGYFSGTATVVLEQGATVVTDFALVPIIAILEYSPASYERTVVLGSVLTDSVVLNNTGTAAFDFYLSDVELGAPGLLVPVTTCPEDSYGYSCTDSNEPGGPAYNFEDISGTGTQIFLSDDEMSSAIPIGFTFDYYEVDYTNVYVSSNGFMSFLAGQTQGCCTGQPIPTPGDPDAIVSAWWEDLYPPGGGSITYQTLGSAPNRVFIVQFTGIDHFPGVGIFTTFQFKLFESGDVIEIHYQDAPSDGGTHSAGIENENGTVGLQYFLGSGGLSTPLAVRYGRATDALWLLELPAIGTVEAGGSETVNLIFDASVITQTGTYTAELRFDGTFDNVVSPAQVVMHVVASGTAGVTVEPDQAGEGVLGTSVSYAVDVTNDGDISDNFALSAVSDQGWNVSLPGSIVLNPGETGTVTVTVDIPAGASAGEVDVTTVTATSSYDGSVSDSANLTTTALAYDVDLEADQSGEGAPGEVVTYTLTLTNSGDVEDTFDLTVSGNTWTTTLDESSVTLAAGDSTTIVVSVTIPAGATNGDSDVATVTATSQGDPTQTDSVTVTTTAVSGYNIYLPIIKKN